MDLSELKEVMSKAVLREELPIEEKIDLRYQERRITPQRLNYIVLNMNESWGL